MTSAFCNLGLRPDQFHLLIMKAKSPIDRKWYFFVEKCLPFGASISCKIFQDFSDCVAHIFKVKSGNKSTVNYLDDYFFASLLKTWCDNQIRCFLEICEEIAFPVSMEKTYWSMTHLVFLGLLIDTVLKLVCLPVDKIQKAKLMILEFLGKHNSKVTVHQLQKLCGTLNFLCKAIVPGRAFTRRLYALTTTKTGVVLKQHHHIKLTRESKNDLEMWMRFLEHPAAMCRPFMDFSGIYTPEQTLLYTDSSRNTKLGCGGWCRNRLVFKNVAS